MALIFDSFPDGTAAENFAAAVRGVRGKKARVFLSQTDSDRVDPFPGELRPPIVLVSRGRAEARVERMVVEFGGEFAGT